MAGSGVSAQFMYVAEVTYGTPVVVTKGIRQTKASFTRTAQRVQSQGVQSGVLGPVASGYVEATAAGEGSLDIDMQSKGMGLLLSNLMGSSTSAQQAASAAYLQTHTLADPVGKFMTMQVGRPLRSGTVVPQTASGCKVISAEFSCNVGEILSSSWEIDAQKVDNTTALAAASYTTGAITFHSGLMALKMGTYGAESAVSGVRGVSVKIDRPQDTEDYQTSNAVAGIGYKSEPVINELTSITGTVTSDWLAKATFEDLANGMTSTSLVWEFVHTVAIASTYYPTFRSTLPGVFFDSGSQEVEGVSELTHDWSFTWRYDGTNMPRIEYMTSDTAI